MKILVPVLIFVTTLTVSVTSLAGMNKEGAINMNGLFEPPKNNVSLSARPGKAELKSPSFFQKVSDTKVTLEWAPAAGAESYHVQVATDANFKWLVKEENFHKATTFEVTGLEGGKHYFWRVSGVKPGNKEGSTHGVFSSSMFATVAK